SSPPPIIREGATPTEAFLTTTQLFLFGKIFDDSDPYNAWGFTPRFAELQDESGKTFPEKEGSNCLGAVLTLGAIYHKMGIPCEMGITADHPFAIVEVEGKTYLSSLYGVEEAKGTFE